MRKHHFLLLLLVFVILNGCTLRPSRSIALAREYRGRAALYRKGGSGQLAVPVIYEREKTCGAVAAYMVTAYLGDPVYPETIVKELFDKRRGGISNRALAAFLRNRGFECYNISADENDLRRFLSMGIAPILIVKNKDAASAHYLVLAGMDAKSGLMVLNNPFCGREYVYFDEMKSSWEKTGNSLLIITRGDTLR